MAIIQQLGINYSTLYCLLIFIFTFFTLKNLVFDHYYKAYEERENRTKGGEVQAQDLLIKTAELKAQFESEAKDINAEVKSIFDEKRAEAQSVYSKIVESAKEEADKYIAIAREHINSEARRASEQLKVEAPSVALVITKKMLD